MSPPRLAPPPPRRQMSDHQPDPANTMRGIGCPQMGDCQAAFLQLIRETNQTWERRMISIEDRITAGDERGTRIEERLDSVYSLLLKAMQASKIKDQALTPSGNAGFVDLSAGPVKVRGRVAAIVGTVLLLGAFAGTAYVLAEWGPVGCASEAHR